MIKKLLALVLVLGTLFTLAACKNTESNVSSEESKATVEYTKGSISNNVYTNEWANIKFELDNTTWKQGSTADYQSYESATTDCGLIAGISSEGRQLAIIFEENPGNAATVNVYLDNVKKGMQSVGLTYVFSDYYEKTIAGKKYVGMDATLAQSGVTVYQTFFATLYDGRFISFVGTSVTGKDEIESALAKITALN